MLAQHNNHYKLKTSIQLCELVAKAKPGFFGDLSLPNPKLVETGFLATSAWAMKQSEVLLKLYWSKIQVILCYEAA